MDRLISAIRTLSIIPLPGKDCEQPQDTLYAFPLVGLLLGILLQFVAYLVDGLPLLSVTALLLIVQTLLTRGFHLDGVADTADGFGGGYSKERSLEIMKDSHIGAFGTIALVLTLLLKAALFHALLQNDALWGIAAAMVISRSGMVFLCVTLPYPRLSGTASSLVKDATPNHLLIALLISALILGLKGWTGILLLPFGIFAAFAWGRYCKKRVDGITGDLLGAANEIVEATVMIAVLILN